jgi:hypothetical protein
MTRDCIHNPVLTDDNPRQDTPAFMVCPLCLTFFSVFETRTLPLVKLITDRKRREDRKLDIVDELERMYSAA